MPSHRFRVGQIVQYQQRKLVGGQASGDFRVERLLPPDGSDLQYRIKSPTEATERVAREYELSDGRMVEALAQDLYTARDHSGVPWARRTTVIQEAWLQAARKTLELR